jgi:hypothetical protein
MLGRQREINRRLGRRRFLLWQLISGGKRAEGQGIPLPPTRSFVVDF